MYSISEDRPRGTSTGQPGREFPVLFHLMDVNRPRAAKQSSTIDSANLLNAVEQLGWPPAEDLEPSAPIVTAPAPAATITETSVPVDSAPIASEPEIASSEPTATTSENIIPTESRTANTPESTDSITSTTNQPAAVTEAASAPTARSPVPSLVTLRKKHRTAASEDWFASHGKYIAVAFVLALVATIYFARVNRERNSVAQQEPTSQPSLVDSTSAVATTNQPAYSPVPTAQTIQTASAAAPATPSPVELRAPQLVNEPSSDKTKDNLFEFAAAKSTDDRIATRPDDATKSTAPAPAATALTAPSLPTAPEVIATPSPRTAGATTSVDASAYPATSSPATHYPVSIPPAATYPTTSPAQPSAPVLAPPGSSGYQPPQSQYGSPAGPPIDYRSQYPVTPASLPQQQPAAQAWNAGQPASYPSYDTTARGPRNERTGSGTY